MIQRILSRRGDFPFVQNRSNLVPGKAGEPQPENLPDHSSRFLVNHQLMLILRRLQIAVGCVCTGELACLCHLASYIPDLFRSVPAVKVIDKIFEGHLQACGLFPSFLAVIPVVHRDKPDSQKGEELFQIIADFNIISAKSGKIFYKNAVHFPLSDQFHQLNKLRAVKLFPTVAIIAFFYNPIILKFRMGFQIIIQKHSLVGNAVAFLFFRRNSHIIIFL